MRSFVLLAATVAAQSCYYPDGSLSTTDIPCSQGSESSCCGTTSFCMDNGLCFGGGILSRGSCTDKSWGSQACTPYCRNDLASSSVPLTPCSNSGGSSTFACGLNGSACSDSSAVFSLAGSGSIVLRPSQVESLVSPEISSLAANCSSNTTLPAGVYTSSEMAALGAGLGVPLLFAICAAIFFFRRERKNAPPKLMYKLPDNHDEFMFQPPPKLNGGRTAPSSLRLPPPGSRGGSDVVSIISSQADTPPAHMQSFADRYKMVGDKLGMVPRAVELPAHNMELEEREKSQGERERERPRGR